MLVFRNEFVVKKEKNAYDFWALIIDWIKKSPHTEFTSNDFDFLEIDDRIETKNQTELLEKSFFPISDPYICGGKYTKWEKNQKWETTIVFNIQKSLISIEIRCENLAIGEVLPQVKPPFLLKKLKDWGGVDKNLQLSSKAHNLPVCDVWKAREIINGNFTLRKPIVYLSATLSNSHVINPSLLAQKLFGLAHVVVEPDLEFGKRLELDIGKKRPTYGSVGIYFPNTERYEIMRRFDDQHDDFIEKIQRRLINITKTAPIDDECSWHYLEQCINEQKIEKIKIKQNQDLNEYIALYEQEIQTLKDENKKLKDENLYLNSEYHRLSAEKHNDACLLHIGNENELYQGEFLDLVLEILQRERKNCDSKRLRRLHVLESLLSVNDSFGKKEYIEREIKQCLEKWQNKPAEKKKLEDLGFSIKADGKHIKLTWKDDERYVITVAKTPSDYRSMKNNASDAVKLLF